VIGKTPIAGSSPYDPVAECLPPGMPSVNAFDDEHVLRHGGDAEQRGLLYRPLGSRHPGDAMTVKERIRWKKPDNGNDELRESALRRRNFGSKVIVAAQKQKAQRMVSARPNLTP
jgi:hypothetical protein